MRFGIPATSILNHDKLSKEEICQLLTEPKKCKHHLDPDHVHNHLNSDSSSVIMSSESSLSIDEPNTQVETKTMNKYVIYPDSTFYNVWIVIKTIFCCTTAFLYPYCTAFGGISYKWNDPLWINIFIGEIVQFLDIIISFLLAY